MESFYIQLTWPQLLIFLQGVQSTFTYMESSYLALQNEVKEKGGIGCYGLFMTDGYVKVQQICVYVVAKVLRVQAGVFQILGLSTFLILEWDPGNIFSLKPACWKICSKNSEQRKLYQFGKCTQARFQVCGGIPSPGQNKEKRC